MTIDDFFARVKTLLGAVNTLLVTLSVAVATFGYAVAPALPDGWQDNFTQVISTIVGVLAGAVTIVRRSYEADPQSRGLLPGFGNEANRARFEGDARDAAEALDAYRFDRE